MAVRIDKVNIITNYNWMNIKNLGNWSALKNSNVNWQQIYQQTINAGAPIKIEVEISEDNWLNLKESFNTWGMVNNNFNSWLDIKNY
ncbi:MAG: hypothetical protein HUJ77_14480 [Clostridium sp.]|uniref:hypothetical protein n=1 Tax=Clostridium sp. TaxID=1506 RepID=UPI0025BE741D|nr:hypothetical protein [Clostridium sp.]MCF0149588.1 hypothetical protein [Clostridium sp.]